MTEFWSTVGSPKDQQDGSYFSSAELMGLNWTWLNAISSEFKVTSVKISLNSDMFLM